MSRLGTLAILLSLTAAGLSAQYVDITNSLYPERYPESEQAALRGETVPADTTHNAGDDIEITSSFVLQYMHQRDSIADLQENLEAVMVPAVQKTEITEKVEGGRSTFDMKKYAVAQRPVKSEGGRLLDDPERARICHEAENGDMESQYQLALIYDLGKGIPRNAAEATYWYRRAARNGHPEALLALGKAFQSGQGVLPDNRIAAENYWRAAERGNVEGAYRFASMLKDGIGVSQDLPRALKYYSLAAETNYEDAAEQVSRLKAMGVRLPAKHGAVKSKSGTAHSTSKAKKKSSGKRRR